MNFKPMITEPCTSENSCYFIFKGDQLVIRDVDNRTVLPSELSFFLVSDKHFIGLIDNVCCYVVSVDSNSKLPESFRAESLRFLFGVLSDEYYSAACYALHFSAWNKKTRYCGCCAGAMKFSTYERAKQCQVCGNTLYPVISPCIIVAVVKEKKSILLAKINRPGIELYSVLAGFVEVGETFEECIHREVMEEVGIKVKNIRYFGSQPWAFSQSLMVGFTAEYESGEIVVDGREIPHADWYEPDSLPKIPLKGTIARDLIDWFLSA